AVFGSGNSSKLETIIKYFKNKTHNIEFVCVSDMENSCILSKAKDIGIENYYLPVKTIEKFLKENHFDLIVLTDYSSTLSSETLKNGIFINIHPSLLPKYKGNDAIKLAYEQGEKITGVTVYIIVDKVDEGPIIAQQAVSISENITIEELEAKIHNTENYLYPIVIEDILFGKKTGCPSGGSCGSGCSGCHK
ncbi:MAG: formyltransferase family protein, partial [Candidatus Gastranaerophilaceae bacterium]